MPAGKPAVLGGGGLVGAWAYAINLRLMGSRAKRGTPALTADELKKCRKALRSALQIYRIDCANPQPTATDRRKVLIKIKTVAQRFVDTLRGSWADKLLTYLDDADP